MSAVGDLLPSNSGSFERAVAAGMSDALPVTIREIKDPASSPPAFMPFLAAERGVDLWYSDWSEARKRQMVAEAAILAARKGTLAAAPAFLSYVDATIVQRITYPTRFVWGRAAYSVTPWRHPAFQSRYLIRVTLKRRPNSFIWGRSAMGREAMRTIDREPIRRARTALLVAKGGDNHLDVRVSFAWRRPATFADALPITDTIPLGRWVDRTHL